MSNLWESAYLDVYDKVLLNSDIYLTVRDFHVNAMSRYENVLDNGAGTGNVTVELLKSSHYVTVVDKSKKALDILRKKCKDYKNLEIHNINAEQLPFENDRFEGITSMFVVYYIDNWKDYLKENYRILKPNGLFAMTGRTNTENSELILQSYKKSLQKRGLMSKFKKEWEIFSSKFKENVMPSVNGSTYEEMVSILEGIGFKDIEEHPNPYFGQCYSLTAKK